VIYYATRDNGFIRVILIGWESTDVFAFSSDKEVKEALIEKSRLVTEYIQQIAGKQYDTRKAGTYTEKIWRTSGGVTIKLETRHRDKMLRMIIYKN
jgi:hypothetical protein